MPYRRRRRRFGRKKSWYNRKYSVRQLASKAWSTARYLKGIVNAEKKHSIISDSSGIDTSGTVTLLSSFAQGDDISARSGNSVKLRSIFTRFSVSQHASATETVVRIIMVQDKQQVTDAAPIVANVLNTVDVLSGLALGLLGRFKVLYDRSLTLSSAGRTAYAFKVFKHMNHHLRWNGSANTDVQKGHIYMILLSDEATNTPTVAFNARCSVYDN